LVESILDHGFVVAIDLDTEERTRLAARIDWYEKNKDHDLSGLRDHVRKIPNNPHSSLLMADGSLIRCFIIDISASGVGVSAEICPAIGTPLAVGRTIGRVVRHFKEGFAVKFLNPLDPERLEQSLLGR
jgi:hypothetical protein